MLCAVGALIEAEALCLAVPMRSLVLGSADRGAVITDRFQMGLEATIRRICYRPTNIRRRRARAPRALLYPLSRWLIRCALAYVVLGCTWGARETPR